MDKVISALSLSKKAGKLILGFDVVKESVQNKTAKLVVLASDVSFKTKKVRKKISYEPFCVLEPINF